MIGYNQSGISTRKNRGLLFILAILCLLPFTCGCLDYFIVQTVGGAVTGAKHMVAPGGASDLQIDAKNGRRQDAGDLPPYFSRPKDVFITYKFDSAIRDLWMQEKVVWKRGRYQVVKQKRVDTGTHSYKAKFPWEKVSRDLGDNWYGNWEACLIVNDHDIGCREFYLINQEEYQKLLQAAKRFKKENKPEKAQEMQKRAKRCNPLAWKPD